MSRTCNIPLKFSLALKKLKEFSASVSVKCTNEKKEKQNSKSVFLGCNQRLWITC